MTQRKYWEKEIITELREFSLTKTGEKNLMEEICFLDKCIEMEGDDKERRRLIRKCDALKKRVIPLRLQINRMERALAVLEPEKRYIIEAIFFRGLSYEDVMAEQYIEHTKFYDLRRCAIQELIRAVYGIDIRHLSGEMPKDSDSDT